MSLPIFDHRTLFPRFSGLWEDLGNVMRLPNGEAIACLPAANIEEKPDAFLISLAVPGQKREDFNIELHNGVLSISSEKEERNETQYTRREFSYQRFKRSFTLPESVQADKIEAKYEDGILLLELPKRTERLQVAKQIQVK